MPTAKHKHSKEQTEVLIPEKLYFRIGEVSELAKLPTYVLRFWETEFSQLKPTKSSTGQRMYRRKDVEYVMRIRKLLYEDGFTIPGAREKLREELRENRSPTQLPAPALNEPEPEHEAQAIVPFLTPESGVQAEIQAGVKAELRPLRQQLREILHLLSRAPDKP